MGKLNENLDGCGSNIFNFFLCIFRSTFKCLLGANAMPDPDEVGCLLLRISQFTSKDVDLGSSSREYN